MGVEKLHKDHTSRLILLFLILIQTIRVSTVIRSSVSSFQSLFQLSLQLPIF
jgi:hypothetical protein